MKVFTAASHCSRDNSSRLENQGALSGKTRQAEPVRLISGSSFPIDVKEEFSTFLHPDSPWQSLWSLRLGQAKSVSGGHPARLAPLMNSPLCRSQYQSPPIGQERTPSYCFHMISALAL